MSTSASRERSLANLNPWREGQSGNPLGRPKSPVDIAALCREHGPEAVNMVVHMMRHDGDSRVRFAAAKELLDRGFGKPVQSIASEDTAATLTFMHLTAMRGLNDARHKEREIDGVARKVADETTSAPRNLMEPATE